MPRRTTPGPVSDPADYLRRLLPGADLHPVSPPLAPELRLWLINADYPVGPLPPEVARTLMEAPPYWAFCWGSGAVLARWVLDNPEYVRGRVVVDFGAGSGVVAVAAAMAGARRSIACDIDPMALSATGMNAALNGVRVETCADPGAFRDGIDVLLAADVLYDRDNLSLPAFFRERAPVVVLADSRVRDFREPGYRRLLSQSCVAMPDLGESAWVRDVTVYGAGF